MARQNTEIFMERLRFAREKRGFTQVALAQQAGMNPSTISHFETGGRKPSIRNLAQLAVALDVTTDFLLGISKQITTEPDFTDRFFMDFSSLTADDQNLARDFVRLLASRNSNRSERRNGKTIQMSATGQPVDHAPGQESARPIGSADRKRLC